MRSMAYAIAALAAIGIVVGIVMMPSETATNAPTVATATSVAGEGVMAEPGKLVLRVPDMHCPFACYPAVKSTLEGESAVESVELTQQEQEGAIDNPEVIVNYEAGFDLNAAIASLAKKGFTKTQVVQ